MKAKSKEFHPSQGGNQTISVFVNTIRTIEDRLYKCFGSNPCYLKKEMSHKNKRVTSVTSGDKKKKRNVTKEPPINTESDDIVTSVTRKNNNIA